MNIRMQQGLQSRTRRTLNIILIAVIIFSAAGCSREQDICGISVSFENALTADMSVEESVKEAVNLLPEIYKEKIKEDGFEIVVTSEPVSEKFKGQVSEKTAGLTDLKERKIYVHENAIGLILHELCHACLYNSKTGTSFYIHYEGCEEEMKESDMDDYYKSNYDEYIVECMSLYLQDETSLDEKAITKHTVEEMLSSVGWIYEQ